MVGSKIRDGNKKAEIGDGWVIHYASLQPTSLDGPWTGTHRGREKLADLSRPGEKASRQKRRLPE